jgi:hypothetical protein
MKVKTVKLQCARHGTQKGEKINAFKISAGNLLNTQLENP